MNKSWFYRTLLSYLPIFFMTTSILILLAFLAMNQMNRSAITKSNEISARQTAAMFDNTLHAIDRLMLKEIEHSEAIARFFDISYRSDSYLSVFGASEMISSMIANESIIDSIYFYRNADRAVLTPKGVLKFDQFGDNPFVSQVLNEEILTYKWTGIRSFQEFIDDGERRQVVSLVRKVPLLSGSDGLIVTNVSVDSLNRLVKEMSYAQFGFIYVYDQSDQLLIRYSEELDSLEESRLDSSGTPLSRFRSSYTGWEFRSGIQTESWLNWMYSLSSFWILFGILTVIAGFVWIIAATRRNYKPIESILGRIHSFSQINMKTLLDRGEDDELKFIESSVESLMEQTTKYQKLHEDDLIFRRRYFFQEVMEGARSITDMEWKNQSGELGLAHEFIQMAVFVVEIDKYAEFCEIYSNKDQYLLKFVVSSVVNEVTEQRECHAWREWIAHDQLGVLVLFQQDVKDGYNSATDLCRFLKHWVEENLNFTVTIGIGSNVLQIADLPISFDEAIDVLRFKSSLGSNKVLLHEELSRKPRGEAYSCLKLIDSIVQAFSAGDAWEDKFDEWFHALEAKMYSFEEIVNQMNYMMYGFDRKFQRLSTEYIELWKEALPSLEHNIGKIESITVLKKQCVEILRKLAEQMEGLRGERTNYSMIMEVKQCLEREYSNSELSLNQISDRFSLHPSYLSRIFKEETGENFIECLLNIRMEHARRLLKESELSIQGVANKVGYLRSISFIRVFKKVNGMTPGDYRKES
ncbi:helix-turn-helix domain-containing protein [Paenibacillus sp. HB172176]|uniref:helix-turn-helix domain-containing protein n=1 Tax=Paenibacillus sp. HB172176 TaxID=2493690 RepID=UPI00143C42C7|nr:helix-turn-helix domain-containing protein [Paenibacillus sp. HB172176]